MTLRMSSQDKAVGGVLREYLTLLSLCRSTGGLFPLHPPALAVQSGYGGLAAVLRHPQAVVVIPGELRLDAGEVAVRPEAAG